eukprot:Lankesteria_metandrocarpae@DN3541_c0_g1_i2.p1
MTTHEAVNVQQQQPATVLLLGEIRSNLQSTLRDCRRKFSFAGGGAIPATAQGFLWIQVGVWFIRRCVEVARKVRIVAGMPPSSSNPRGSSLRSGWIKNHQQSSTSTQHTTSSASTPTIPTRNKSYAAAHAATMLDALFTLAAELRRGLDVVLNEIEGAISNSIIKPMDEYAEKSGSTSAGLNRHTTAASDNSSSKSRIGVSCQGSRSARQALLAIVSVKLTSRDFLSRGGDDTHAVDECLRRFDALVLQLQEAKVADWRPSLAGHGTANNRGTADNRQCKSSSHDQVSSTPLLVDSNLDRDDIQRRDHSTIGLASCSGHKERSSSAMVAEAAVDFGDSRELLEQLIGVTTLDDYITAQTFAEWELVVWCRRPSVLMDYDLTAIHALLRKASVRVSHPRTQASTTTNASSSCGDYDLWLAEQFLRKSTNRNFINVMT